MIQIKLPQLILGEFFWPQICEKRKIFGTLSVLISVTFGALNTHYLKSILPKIALDSIDVSLRYMMYHGLGLLIISILPIKEKRYIINLFIVGTLLFSLSILILSFQSISKSNLGWLGPLTPMGGILLIGGWIILLYSFIREK